MKESVSITEGRGLKIVLAITRYVMAVQFLWAFIDKLFGLGFATPPGKGWISGGSPTFGFLKKGATGPFTPFFNAIGGAGITDWLFMLALLFIGLALLLGIAMKIGTISGSILMFFMWAAALPKPNNILQIDEHIVYILVLLILMFLKAGQIAGLGKSWSNTRLVKRFPGFE
jgi:thiosulfate dehydrogenase [quinone] large subunit